MPGDRDARAQRLAAERDGDTESAGSSARWLNIWLCFLLTMVGYIDRTNLAVAAPAIKGDLHIGDATMGLVLGSFYWTYAGLQLPCGMLVDRMRLRGGIAASVTAWSLATIGTAWATGAASLFALRLALGAGEGPIYPAAGRLIATAGFIGALLSATGGSFDASLVTLGAICLLSAACFHFWVGDIVRVEVGVLVS